MTMMILYLMWAERERERERQWMGSLRDIRDLSISDRDERADFVMNFVKAENSRVSFCSLSVPTPFGLERNPIS